MFVLAVGGDYLPRLGDVHFGFDAGAAGGKTRRTLVAGQIGGGVAGGFAECFANDDDVNAVLPRRILQNIRSHAVRPLADVDGDYVGKTGVDEGFYHRCLSGGIGYAVADVCFGYGNAYTRVPYLGVDDAQTRQFAHQFGVRFVAYFGVDGVFEFFSFVVGVGRSAVAASAEKSARETDGKNVVKKSLFVHAAENSFFRFLRDFVNFYFFCGCRGAAN